MTEAFVLAGRSAPGAGLRYDTSGTESGTGPRWHLGSRPDDGYVVRHPPGY